MNYHKKGEHVFNDFVKTIENVKDGVIKEVRAVYPQATKDIFNRSYRAHIGQIETHPLIVEGRRLKSLPSGELIDQNSEAFGLAAYAFQQAMLNLTRAIVHKTGNPDFCKGDARSAWLRMAAAGVDETAYQRLLAATPAPKRAEIEDVYRRFKVMLQHEFPLLGSDIIRTIGQDVQDYMISRSTSAIH